MLILIHSYIFIKCYLIHLEKACFLGFIWEFNHRLKLLRLGKAEQTFRKYLLVLCTPPVRLSDELSCAHKSYRGGTRARPLCSSPIAFLLPNCTDRRHLTSLEDLTENALTFTSRPLPTRVSPATSPRGSGQLLVNRRWKGTGVNHAEETPVQYCLPFFVYKSAIRIPSSKLHENPNMAGVAFHPSFQNLYSMSPLGLAFPLSIIPWRFIHAAAGIKALLCVRCIVLRDMDVPPLV